MPKLDCNYNIYMILYKYNNINKRYLEEAIMADEKATFNYEIVETLGSLSESNKGWKKVVNYISWNGKEPKYDIREWAPDGEKMGKGVTLSKEEMANLKALLNKIDLD